MRFIRSRLTYANVVATLALVVALAGGTAFAASQMLPRNSVGAKQIKKEAVGAGKLKNGAVTGPKIAAGAVTGPDINLGTLGPVPSSVNANHASSADNATHSTSADNAVNASTVGGKPASAFAPSTAVRSALIEANGTVVASKSSGITQANVEVISSGNFCIKNLSPAPVNAVATIAFGAAADSRIYLETGEPACQVEIQTRSSMATTVGEPFQIMLH